MFKKFSQLGRAFMLPIAIWFCCKVLNLLSNKVE